MKINTKLALLFAVLALPGGSIAQDSPTIKASGLRIIHGVAGDDDNKLVPFNTFNKGTGLALLVGSPSSIIMVDTDASKIDSFTDDKGTDLLTKVKGSFQQPGFGSFPEISEDGKMALVEIAGDGVPVAGANAIKAEGTLVVQTASEKEAVKSEPFELKKGSKLKVGDIDLKVTGSRKPSFGDNALEVNFETSNKLVTMLAGVKFLDAAGKELESEGAGSSRMGFGKKFTYGRSFSLKKAVKGEVILEFEVWTDLAETKIPFSITAGVGG